MSRQAYNVHDHVITLTSQLTNAERENSLLRAKTQRLEGNAQAYQQQTSRQRDEISRLKETCLSNLTKWQSAATENEELKKSLGAMKAELERTQNELKNKEADINRLLRTREKEIAPKRDWQTKTDTGFWSRTPVVETDDDNAPASTNHL